MAEDDGHRSKRRKVNNSLPEEALAPINDDVRGLLQKSITRPISPPPSKRRDVTPSSVIVPTWGFDNVPEGSPSSKPQSLNPQPDAQQNGIRKTDSVGTGPRTYLASPFQLTHIRDLAPQHNVDTISLKDVLGNPMIKELWNFNFLFDVDFVMEQLDEDTRDIVKVKLIHGFWRNDDERRIAMLEAAEKYRNVEVLHAYIPDPFGTHHSKMLVIFTHDDQAQIIIHTANMIPRDWGNMTQAVWQSPRLPLLSHHTNAVDVTAHRIGTGERFKIDFLRYLAAYGKRIDSAVTQLRGYDFSAIRAAFIGSVPSRQKPAEAKPCEQTSFGWLGLQEIMSMVPSTAKVDKTLPPHIVMQVSSIATLGATPVWLKQFQSALTNSAVVEDTTKASKLKRSSFFTKQGVSVAKSSSRASPKFSIIFPTPDEIRSSLDGYACGGSIHMKVQSQQQQKQLEYLHPLFCRWNAAPDSSRSRTEERQGQALRGRAAPHIKTYVRYSDKTHKSMDWAMVTSANLSKQAWGDVVNKKDEVWIQSWEAGVVVWPALFAEPDAQEEEAVMVPVFGKDMPDVEDDDDVKEAEEEEEEEEVGHDKAKSRTVVGFRMPYDLPLTPYALADKPWCATMQYPEPDWKGLSWGG
ncbi:hypothetical protein ACEQ8H_004936 [Pleosporales sp. CAS-2024a]